ncbi:hypothetical protein [Methylosinus sp. Sm6]|uniref:hypothetical protein n=1 Tax=Methylosinus sp. Sm6 TaxID=2866948 RepID=UPI001C994095|nr:hypothetical protein [Methylosinus sp. Sm6]MBY6243211.1 hypothetical protein [Methylosinus sp. Sm6]
MRIALFVVVSAALVGTVAAEAAGRRSHRPQYEDVAPIVVPVDLCEKMCPQDVSPCDPIHFKIADARCAQIGPGR